MRKRNDNYDLAAILEDLRAGEDYDSIIARHNVSRATVSRIAIENGMRRRAERKASPRYDMHRTCGYVNAENAALRGGQWVQRGLVWVWQVDDEMEAS